jgi:hypothetical protein
MGILCLWAQFRRLKRRLPMSDIIALLYGSAIFTLFFLYVPLAERV